MISSSSRQFLFDYKVVNNALDNLLISGSEIFIDLSIKRGVRKLPQSFFLVGIYFSFWLVFTFYPKFTNLTTQADLSSLRVVALQNLFPAI